MTMMRTDWRHRCLGPILALGAILILGHGPARAQGVPKEDRKIYARKSTFKMPIEIDDAMRAQLREVRLYVKAGNSDWVQQESADPSVKFFVYRVSQDGEYWFSVATVDRAGKMSPADLNKELPGLQVVVDTQPPVLDLRSVATPDGEMCVCCTMQDANPDIQSIRISFQGSDGMEHALEPHPFKAGLFRVPAELWGGKVRISAADKCGNRAMREAQLAPSASTPNSLPQSVTGTPASINQTASAGPPASINQTAGAGPPASINQTAGGGTVTQTNYVSGGEPSSVGNIPTTIPDSTNSVPAKVVSGPGANTLPPEIPEGPFAPPEIEPSTPTVEPQQNSGNSGPAPKLTRQVLNTTHASLDYRIDPVGPSGVGKVEIWVTADQGQTWRRLGEDADRQSPADIDLPGEGLFGVRLVITNGNGFGGSPPTRGEQPSAWIEVDTTAPFVTLRDVDPVTDGGSLTIRWSAKDKNLISEPVSLYFRTRPEGPWQVVARGLKNDGSHRWTFPHNMGSQFFFKIEVADQAGNIGRAETTNPVVLDMTEPRAVVMGINGIRPRSP